MIEKQGVKAAHRLDGTVVGGMGSFLKLDVVNKRSKAVPPTRLRAQMSRYLSSKADDATTSKMVEIRTGKIT